MTSDTPTLVFLAAGASSRFFPFDTAHKSFLTLGGKPLIVHALQHALSSGFTHLVVVVSHQQESLLRSFLESYQLSEQVKLAFFDQASGQGDALLAAREHITTSHFIVASPYYITVGEFAQKLWQKQQSTQANGVFLGAKTNQPELFGMIQHDGDRFLGVIEKPQPNQAPSEWKVLSVYLFDQGLLEELSRIKGDHYSLETAYTQYAQNHHLVWEAMETSPANFKYAWHLFEIQAALFQQLTSHRDHSAHIAPTASIDESGGPVFIDKGANIMHGARIVGPCYIGEGVIIGDYSLVRQSHIEAKATVGANTEVVRSIVMPGSTLHYGYLADSILGEKVKVGGGLITANKRLDRQPVTTMVKDQKVSTGRTAVGTLIGHQTQVGIRVSTMPGVLIGSYSTIYPGELVKKNVPHHTVAQ